MHSLCKQIMNRLERRCTSPVLGRCCASLPLATLLACLAALSGCTAATGNIGTPGPAPTLSGNWQFTMAPPGDGSYTGGLQGGFLLQNGSATTGSVAYSVAAGNAQPCNVGSAAVTGTLDGEQVSLTATAGTQTFTLTGTLSPNNSSMAGTYNSTAGTGSGGSACGTVQSGVNWYATLVPPLTGSLQGTFHSSGGAAGLNEQDFPVTGSLTQAVNTGSSSANLTGTLTFVNPETNVSQYPCFASAPLTGAVSGTNITLQIGGAGSSIIGQIGSLPGSTTGLNPLTFEYVTGGNILLGPAPSYMVATGPPPAGSNNACPGSLSGPGSQTPPGDYGSVCLAINGTSLCPLPLTLNPNILSFEPQSLDSPPTSLTITLTNTNGSALNALTLSLANNTGPGDFTETDTCGPSGLPSAGAPFALSSNQACVITITFTPQQDCPSGTPSISCLTATLSATSPDNDAVFTVAVSGGVTPTSGSLQGHDRAANGIAKSNFSGQLWVTRGIAFAARKESDADGRSLQE